MTSSLGELESRAHREIAYDRRGDQLTGGGKTHQPGCDVYSETPDIIPNSLDFAGVQAATYRDPDSLNPPGDREPATGCAGRPLEHAERAVACVLHLPPTVPDTSEATMPSWVFRSDFDKHALGIRWSAPSPSRFPRG